MPHRSRVRMTGPLALYQDVIWTELLACGYTRLSARNVLQLAAHLSRWLEANGLSPEDLSSVGIDRKDIARTTEPDHAFHQVK